MTPHRTALLIVKTLLLTAAGATAEPAPVPPTTDDGGRLDAIRFDTGDDAGWIMVVEGGLATGDVVEERAWGWVFYPWFAYDGGGFALVGDDLGCVGCQP